MVTILVEKSHLQRFEDCRIQSSSHWTASLIWRGTQALTVCFSLEKLRQASEEFQCKRSDVRHQENVAVSHVQHIPLFCPQHPMFQGL